jgi:hypothetical protein
MSENIRMDSRLPPFLCSFRMVHVPSCPILRYRYASSQKSWTLELANSLLPESDGHLDRIGTPLCSPAVCFDAIESTNQSLNSPDMSVVHPSPLRRLLMRLQSQSSFLQVCSSLITSTSSTMASCTAFSFSRLFWHVDNPDSWPAVSRSQFCFASSTSTSTWHPHTLSSCYAYIASILDRGSKSASASVSNLDSESALSLGLLLDRLYTGTRSTNS